MRFMQARRSGENNATMEKGDRARWLHCDGAGPDLQPLLCLCEGSHVFDLRVSGPRDDGFWMPPKGSGATFQACSLGPSVEDGHVPC